MTKARGVFWLYAVLALLGTGVTGLALFAATASVRWDTPSVATLIAACRSFALPEVTASSLLALLLGSGAFAVLARAARSAARQVAASQRYLRQLDVVGPAPFGTPRTFVYRDDAPGAFCAGLLRPCVFLSTATLRVLTPDELEAVLAHELHHARCRDPLRLLAARTVSEGLFFLPGMRQLASRYAALAEIAADGAAVRANGGSRRALASALLAFESATSPAVVGIAPERVDSLLGDRPPWELPLALLASALVVLTAVAVVAMRVGEAAAHGQLNLPAFLASACTAAMAVLPLAVGAKALLRSGVLLRWGARQPHREPGSARPAIRAGHRGAAPTAARK